MPPDDPPPKSRRDEAPALPDLVADLVEPLARDTADPLRRIRLAWGHICGNPLGRHIEPLRLEGNTLHIGARGPVWRDAVFLQRATLLSHVRRYAPRVERIWLHTLEGPPSKASAPLVRPALTTRTDGISDPDLRLALERLMAARRGSTPDDG